MKFPSYNVTGVAPQIMAALAGGDLVHAIEANEIFVRLPEDVMNALSAGGVGFQRWGNDGQARFVCTNRRYRGTGYTDVPVYLAFAITASLVGHRGHSNGWQCYCRNYTRRESLHQLRLGIRRIQGDTRGRLGDGRVAREQFIARIITTICVGPL